MNMKFMHVLQIVFNYKLIQIELTQIFKMLGKLNIISMISEDVKQQ